MTKHEANYDFWESPLVYQTFKIVQKNPGLNVKEIALKSKASQNITSQRIKPLKQQQLVLVKKDWKKRNIFINEEMFQKMFKKKLTDLKEEINSCNNFKELLERTQLKELKSYDYKEKGSSVTEINKEELLKLLSEVLAKKEINDNQKK